MAEAHITVDLFNPGQVFACLGFLEAAEALCGNAEGGFDWEENSLAADARFKLRAAGSCNPIGEVLEFLATAEIQCLKPIRWTTEPRKGESPLPTETFPERIGGSMALPIRLGDSNRKPVDIDHWADGSSRKPFKLYAGNRSAYSIACNMLHGNTKKGIKGVKDLFDDGRVELSLGPFDKCTPMGGSFNFDPRGAWTAIDVGYSPDTQTQIKVVASPVLEILAAWGLQHARPDEYKTRQVRYGAWGALVPPLLARPALAGVDVAIPIRKFEFTLNLSGKNKVVTYSTEEVA